MGRCAGGLLTWSASAALVASGAVAGAEIVAPPGLELVQAWSVEGPGNFQPSGLALRDDALFLVSDKHSDAIFRVEFAGEVARCVEAVAFSGPQPLPEHGWLDLEAIAVAPEGGWLLSSEEAARVLRVPPGGGAAAWFTPDLRIAGRPAGLMAQHNAYGEGLALCGDDCLLVAVEREPRGLIEIAGSGAAAQFRPRKMDASVFPIPAGRSFDFADLARWDGRIFTLARNQHLVVELTRGPDGDWRESGAAWSYAATENAPQFSFRDKRWGLGEGLAIDDESIYVVTDNGQTPREGSGDDRRPWLWRFRNPIGPRPANP